MGRFVQTATPLVLLAMAFLVWFEKWLPGAAAFGETGVLRFCVGILCVYLIVLINDRQRLEVQFSRVLKAFKEFHDGRAGTAEPGQARLEAVRLLVGALGSADAEVRSSSQEHLKRLTGQDFGDDRAAWERWLKTQGESGGGQKG